MHSNVYHIISWLFVSPPVCQVDRVPREQGIIQLALIKFCIIPGYSNTPINICWVEYCSFLESLRVGFRTSMLVPFYIGHSFIPLDFHVFNLYILVSFINIKVKLINILHFIYSHYILIKEIDADNGWSQFRWIGGIKNWNCEKNKYL